jgi:hypothetical protein
MHKTDLWRDLAGLSGTSLKTLGRGNGFDIVSVDGKGVVIRPHGSGTERMIARGAFEGAFDAICSRGSLDLKGIRTFNEMNPVYIAAMLAQLPCISWDSKPKILLRHVAR